MNELIDRSCEEVRDAAAEYGLGLLGPDETTAVARHLMSCPDCRREVDQMAALGEELIDLVPDAEPPLGFDRRVLAGIGPAGARKGTLRSSRTKLIAGMAAVAVAALVVAVVTSTGGGRRHHTLDAVLTSGGRAVGSVYTEGRPTWVWMNVHGAPVSGSVKCELVEWDGRLVPIGNFDLVKGNGAWAAPVPPATTPVTGARLVAPDGTVVATAVFKS